jgi:hypothetical protein
MKIDQENIDLIRNAFEKMHSREDLLNLLNVAKRLIYGDKSVPFKLKQLTWHANPKLGGKRYVEFKIKKKSGSERSIHAPVKGLKSLQKTLNLILQCVYEPHNAALGFVKGKSIVDNAKLHIGSKYVYNIDLKDFFPSIDQARIWKCLQLKPINLNDIKVVGLEIHPKSKNVLVVKFDNGIRAIASIRKCFIDDKDKKIAIFCKENGEMLEDWDVRCINNINWIVKISDIDNWTVPKRKISNRKGLSNIIASLCCTEMEVERKNETGGWEKVKRNVLPQGAPTSPVITNIVCQKLDYLLTGVAKRFGLKYSRYADDITFSSMHNVYQPGSDFLNEIHRIIAEQNFHIKESKTRLQKDGYRKEVTGLLVNEKANVQLRYIKQLRMWLYFWERYGYERASDFFLKQYIADKGHVKNTKPEMAKVIAGKLDYLRMVRGEDNKLYQKLKARFEIMLNSNNHSEYSENRRNHLNEILSAIISNGIEHAMSKYKIYENK